MVVEIESNCPQRLKEASVVPRGPVHPSPRAWRDQVVYHLLIDRFSDGKEQERDLYDWRDPDSQRLTTKSELSAWREAGNTFLGGNLKNVASKLEYLKTLGATTLWISPVCRQREDIRTYHGYAIQNFLEVDRSFGSRKELRELVDAVHEQGMYVILDIVYNHTGNNWFYRSEDGNAVCSLPYRPRCYEFGGWRSGKGECLPLGTPLGPDDGVWPEEFQDPDWYLRRGHIRKEHWSPAFCGDDEFLRGDFFDLKKLNLHRGDVLSALVHVYSYWVALSDCDGFRLDSLKHVDLNASRQFAVRIREFAESIGKDNFLLLGEVLGDEDLKAYHLGIEELSNVVDQVVIRRPAPPRCVAVPGDGSVVVRLGLHR